MKTEPRPNGELALFIGKVFIRAGPRAEIEAFMNEIAQVLRGKEVLEAMAKLDGRKE